MEARIGFTDVTKGLFDGLFKTEMYLKKCGLDHKLLELIKCRVSQINGCAYCLDMHSKDLLAEGENAQRLLVLDAWRETPFFSDREQAALAWAEAVTKLTNNDVSDEVYETARQQFSEQELIDLTMAVVTINCYNRINVAFRVQGGSYKVGQFTAEKLVNHN